MTLSRRLCDKAPFIYNARAKTGDKKNSFENRMGDEAEMKLVAAWYDDQFGSEDPSKTYQPERLLPRIE